VLDAYQEDNMLWGERLRSAPRPCLSQPELRVPLTGCERQCHRQATDSGEEAGEGGYPDE